MAGGNPFMPPGANPGGPVPQMGVGQGPGGQSISSAAPNRGRLSEVGRAPFNGAGASILAPGGGMQPPSGASPNGGVLPSQQGQPFAGVHQNFRQAQNQFQDGLKAQQVLDHLRVELDGLMDHGDMVRPEHVIEAAGRLVGHGIGASQLAQIMSDMPATGGEGLASWIRMHDVTISQAEQQLIKENNFLQHNMGVAAFKSIAASHLEQTTKMGEKPHQHIDLTGGASMGAPQAAPTPDAGAGGNDLGSDGGSIG